MKILSKTEIIIYEEPVKNENNSDTIFYDCYGEMILLKPGEERMIKKMIVNEYVPENEPETEERRSRRGRK